MNKNLLSLIIIITCTKIFSAEEFLNNPYAAINFSKKENPATYSTFSKSCAQSARLVSTNEKPTLKSEWLPAIPAVENILCDFHLALLKPKDVKNCLAKLFDAAQTSYEIITIFDEYQRFQKNHCSNITGGIVICLKDVKDRLVDLFHAAPTIKNVLSIFEQYQKFCAEKCTLTTGGKEISPKDVKNRLVDFFYRSKTKVQAEKTFEEYQKFSAEKCTFCTGGREILHKQYQEKLAQLL